MSAKKQQAHGSKWQQPDAELEFFFLDFDWCSDMTAMRYQHVREMLRNRIYRESTWKQVSRLLRPLARSRNTVWAIAEDFIWRNLKKSDLCAANKYMTVSHSTDNSQSLNDSSRAPCSQEKSEDVSRGWHAWLLPEKADVTVWGKLLHYIWRWNKKCESASQMWAVREKASLKMI